MKKMTIQVKIILSSVIATIVPFVLFGLLAYHEATTSLKHQAVNSAVNAVTSLSNLVNEIITNEEKLVAVKAKDPEIIRLVSLKRFDRCKNELLVFFENYASEYETLIIIDDVGISRVEASTKPIGLGLNLSNRLYFQQAMKGHTNISEPIVSRGTGEIIFAVASPIQAGADQIVGVMALLINIEYIIKKFNSIKIGDTGFAFMINKNGTVISHPMKSYILNHNFLQRGGVAPFAEQIISGESGAIVIETTSGPKMLAYAPVPSTGWVSLMLQDMSEIMTPANNIKNNLLPALAVATGLILLGLFISSKIVSSPIEKSLEVLEQLIRLSPDAVINIGIDKKIISMNPAAQALTGFQSEEMAGSVITINPAKGISEQEIWEQLFLAKSWSGYTRLQTKDGRELTLDVLVFPIQLEKRTITGFIQVGRDVTNKLLMERRMAQAQKMEAIGTLAGGIAHDFNNILGGIFGHIELSLLSLDDKDKVRRSLDQVLKAGKRAREMVKQILTFSRKHETIKSAIKPRIVLKEAVNLLKAGIPSSIEIETDLKSEALIFGDQTQFHQVIINLCTNAVHSMESRKGKIHMALSDIEVDSQFAKMHPGLELGQHILLRITDTGRGIKPETIDHIFEPFFTTKTNDEGTGLGLSVVHGIVKSLNGTISVYSEVGKGTTFSIIIPTIAGYEEEQETGDKAHIIGGTESILFVDDEELILNANSAVLKNLGYTVNCIMDSEEALRVFQENCRDYDLILTDFAMPQMNGLELALKCRALRKEIPVVMASGIMTEKLETKFSNTGIRHFLKKPAGRKELADVIRKALDQIS